MRKLALLFLIVFLGGLFFPLVSLASGDYLVDVYNDANHNCQYDPDKGETIIGTKTVHYQGLVPCGKSEPASARYDDEGNVIEEAEDDEVTMRCQFCHFFVMLDGIIDFTVKYIVIPVAVLMIVVGGIMFMFSQFGGAEMLPGGVKGGPAMLSRAKSLITSVIIGLVIIFASYLIIGFVLAVMGLADTNPIKDWFTGDSFTINCPIKLPQ